MSKYSVPAWSTIPTESFDLEVLKDGSIISHIPISSQPTYIFGRNHDACDIVLDHQSISREHAALQFGDRNELYLMDLGSAHGTKRNKIPVVANEFVRLNVGDILSFGASTRLYIVNGPTALMPDEYDSQNTRLVRKQMHERSEELAKRAKEEEEAGISWGFDEDAENSSDEEDVEEEKANLPDYIKNDPNYDRKFGKKYSSAVKESEVHERDKELLEKIKAKERKIQNMQEENRRIYMKENSQEGGLTEGQMAAVARNDERIQALMSEIDEIHSELNSKKSLRESKAATSRMISGKKDIREDSDFFDLTSDTADASTNWRLRKKQGKGQTAQGPQKKSSAPEQVLTYESLQHQFSLEKRKLDEIARKIAEENGKIIDESVEIVSGDMDGVLRLQESAEAKASLKRLLFSEQEQMKKVAVTERLLKLATPALVAVSRSSDGGAAQASSATATNIENCGVPLTNGVTTSIVAINSDSQRGASAEITTLRAPANLQTENRSAQSVFQSGLEEDSMSRLQVPIHPIEDDESRKDVQAVGSESLKRKVIGPAFNPSFESKPPKVARVARQPRADKPVSYSENTLEGGDHVWIPPKGQTGDGYTSLNEKYGY
jgi:pSer/pThr/pTyr-binding forkhead associated (FHA) protein